MINSIFWSSSAEQSKAAKSDVTDIGTLMWKILGVKYSRIFHIRMPMSVKIPIEITIWNKKLSSMKSIMFHDGVNTYDPNRQFHPVNFSSNGLFIQRTFHPMDFSTIVLFIHNTFSLSIIFYL